MQKFYKGDVVRLAEVFPESMAHFPGKGKVAVVIGDFEQVCGHNGSPDKYCLYVENAGEVSWYPASLMTLLVGRMYCPTCDSKLKR